MPHGAASVELPHPEPTSGDSVPATRPPQTPLSYEPHAGRWWPLLWQGWGKERGASCLVQNENMRSKGLQAPGRSEWAGRCHLPPRELLHAAFNHVNGIGLPNPVANAAPGNQRKPKQNLSGVSSWSLEKSSVFISAKWGQAHRCTPFFGFVYKHL